MCFYFDENDQQMYLCYTMCKTLFEAFYQFINSFMCMIKVDVVDTDKLVLL